MGLHGFPGIRNDIILIQRLGTEAETRTPLATASVQGTQAILPEDVDPTDGDVLEVPSKGGGVRHYRVSEVRVFSGMGDMDHIEARATRIAAPEPQQRAAGRKVFISHTSADRDVVQDLVRLLETGIGVAHGDIFCTSMPGAGVSPGDDFVATIQREASGTMSMLAVVSPAFLGSLFSWSELGAAWVLSKQLIPLLYSAVEFSDLNSTVIRGLHGLRLAEPTDLDVLRDKLTAALGLAPRETARWSAERDLFLRRHGETIGAARVQPTTVPTVQPFPEGISDATQAELLRDRLPKAGDFFLFAQLDELAGVPPGTSARFAIHAAKAEGRYQSATPDGIRLTPWSAFKRS